MERDGDAKSQRSGNSGASGVSETSSQRSDTKFLRKRAAGIQARNAEEADVLEQKRNIQEGVFACMYTLVRRTAMSTWKFAVLKIVLEFLMNFIVVFNQTFKAWRINYNNPVWQVIRWTVWRAPIMRMYGYTTYVIVMYIMAAAVLLAVVGLAWLTLAMRKQEQSKMLRIAGLGLHVVFDVFFGMCYVSFFDYFTFMAGCDFGGTKRHAYFKDVACLEMPHLLHMLVSLSAGLLFFCVTALVVVASCDLDPVSRGLLASPAAYARLKILFTKASFIIFANCLDSHEKIQVVGLLASTTLIVYWNLRAMPFYNNYINVVWTGLWGGILHVVVLLAIVAYGNGDSEAYHEQMTMFVLFGIWPVTVGGMLLTGVYVWWAMRHARKFRDLPPGIKLCKVHKFESVYEVERLARVMRMFDRDGLVEESAAALGETIIKAGLQTFPNTPHLLILYANFVLEVRKDGPSARTQLQLVGKQMPNIVERYQVFCTYEASKRLKGSQEQGMDLQAYIEFKRNLRAVLRVHKEVLVQQSELWLLCMRSTLRVSQIDAALDSLEATSARADQVYRRVLERYPTNGKLLRCYGKFLEDVRHDQVAAARAYAGANRVGATNALLSLDFSGAVHGATDSSKPEFLTSMSMEEDAVVVIDAEGTIMMVSQAVQKTFGYTKTELEGANVAVLMPQPFSQRHAGYVQRYTSNNEPHVLDTVREVVALHKERYVFPVALCITKLSGVGTDSIFLGVIRPLPTSVFSVRAWICSNGVILCADQQFSSSIGMVEGDLVGHTVASLVLEPQAVTDLLERCQAATAAELEAGDITTELTFHHRYLEPVPFRVEVRMAGSDYQRILVIHCRRMDGQDSSMLAVDTHMRVKFASCEVALLLGYSMRKLATMRLDQLLPPPFNALHAKWLRDPSHTSRPGSCCTGAVVGLVSDTGAQVPVRLTICTKEIETAGASGSVPLHIVKVMKSTQDEIFREKRMVLTVGFAGKVLTVSPTDSTMFEFPASSLVGANLADCVDIFADWRQRSGDSQMQMILLALLGKEQEMPGTSWRVRVHKPSTTPRRISRPACLQVELEEEAEDEGDFDSGDAGMGVRIQVALWRRDLLSGVVELDEELVIRRASPLTGLITGIPTSAMLRKPLSTFLNIPRGVSWEKLVAASSHGHHKKSALKATQQRGSISPIMALIGPHPDSGTMRLMVQGVQTLGPGGRPKITITIHPDTTFLGAHANLMRVLRLDSSYGGGDSSVHVDDDVLSSHIGRQTRTASAAASTLRSRSFSAAISQRNLSSSTGKAQDSAGANCSDGSANRDDCDGSLDAEAKVGQFDEGIDCSRRVGYDAGDAGSGAELSPQTTSIHRQATSKSEFVEQWVRSVTQQAAQLELKQKQQHARPGHGKKAAASAAQCPSAAGEPTDGLARKESSLLALPFGSTTTAGMGLAADPCPWTASHLAAVPETVPDQPDEEALQGHVNQPGQANEARDHRQRAVSRLLSFAVTGSVHAIGASVPQEVQEPQQPAAEQAGERNCLKDVEDGAVRSDADGSSADDGSQAASTASVAMDETSVSEVVIDARRARLLSALSKVMSGPALTAHIDSLRLQSYGIVTVMFLVHLICYIVVTTLIKEQYKNVYSVHRQALAMDRSQLIVVRTILGTYCERANVTVKVAGCSNPLNISVSKLTTNVMLMEQYHQGVYMGFDPSTVSEPAASVYNIWTTPIIDYQVFLDTHPSRIVVERAGAWQIGNRYIAAAREALYWMLRCKENFRFHRAFTFILWNGIGPLFKAYADSLDHLVQAAWENTGRLRHDVLILMIVEALCIQLGCTLRECQMIYRLEAARLLGMLALVGLPSPVLRQLNMADTKIVDDSDDGSDEGGSIAGSDDNTTKHVNGGTRSMKLSEQAAVALPMPLKPVQAAAKKAIAGVDATPTGGIGGCSGTGTAGALVTSENVDRQERSLRTRTLHGMRFYMSSKARAGGGSDDAKKGSSSQRLSINGKTLIPSHINLARFMVPFLLWTLAVLVVYIVTMVQLTKLEQPLASLDLAARITYRYTRIRAIGAAFVTQDDTVSKDAWRPLLSSEIDTFESEYDALMYGGIPRSMDNSTFRRYVPAATFASASFARWFFRQKGCMRYDQSACFPPGDEYYEITHNGLDAMVRRMVYEMRMLSFDDAADVTYNSSRYAYTSIVGANDLYEGLQQAAQMFVDYSISHYNNIITMHTVLLVISVVMVLAFFFFLLWPTIAKTLRDASRQSALLSLVPPEWDVRAHVRAVFRQAAAQRKRAAGNSKQQEMEAQKSPPTG